MRLFEMVELLLLGAMLIPDTEIVGLKKSNRLLLLIRFPVFGAAALPRAIRAFVGRFAPAGPILFPDTMLLLFPPRAAVLVLNRTFPPAVPTAAVDEPDIVQFAKISFWAPLINRTVLVPAVAETVVFERVSALYPSIRTFLAPFRLSSGLPATIAPETVLVP